ncbi:MAG TPA: hypothetical protein VKC35_15515, partial [Vicinamibacterales bacterium]|nr:hypothetical protein [Vicinamibacterales bacterium]
MTARSAHPRATAIVRSRIAVPVVAAMAAMATRIEITLSAGPNGTTTGAAPSRRRRTINAAQVDPYMSSR